MVCCAVAAAVLGAALWVKRRLFHAPPSGEPLAWRLHASSEAP